MDEPKKKTVPSARLGATGDAVRLNVRRLRDAQGVSAAELSKKLEGLGRTIPLVGIQRIEAGTRRVDADDLVALAMALGASPATLLITNSSHGDCPTTVTGLSEPAEAQHVWAWITANQPFPNTVSLLDFWGLALPDWLRNRMTTDLQNNRRVLPPSALLIQPTTDAHGDDK